MPVAVPHIRMKMIGISVFGTAIGILGSIASEQEYEAITAFRSGFYADNRLAALDVRLTRPFIGHITLAYIEDVLSEAEKETLSSVLNRLNREIESAELYFVIGHTGLRRYHHLAEFIREDHYPVFNFTA